MIQTFLYLLQLVVLGIFGISALVFTGLALKNKNRRPQFTLYLSLSAASVIITLITFSIDLHGAESSDREETVEAFVSNFGFEPPPAIKEIKVKNFTQHDAFIHWMAFTYDVSSFNEILQKDQPLDTVYRHTAKFADLFRELEKYATNAPGWWQLPAKGASEVYVKENFLRHSFSDYHLWVDKELNMVYLQVSYFD